MKSIQTIFISLAILLFTACFSSNNIDVSREDVLGSWDLSTQSLKKIDIQKETSTITSFHLTSTPLNLLFNKHLFFSCI